MEGALDLAISVCAAVQLEEHYTGIAEVMSSNPLQA